LSSVSTTVIGCDWMKAENPRRSVATMHWIFEDPRPVRLVYPVDWDRLLVPRHGMSTGLLGLQHDDGVRVRRAHRVDQRVPAEGQPEVGAVEALGLELGGHHDDHVRAAR
jgi:hypothetical protein